MLTVQRCIMLTITLYNINCITFYNVTCITLLEVSHYMYMYLHVNLVTASLGLVIGHMYFHCFVFVLFWPRQRQLKLYYATS